MKEYNQGLEVKAWQKEYIKEYCQEPTVKLCGKEYKKEYRKEYRQRPEVKVRRNEYKKEYRQRPEVKAKRNEYRKEYMKRPEVKAKRNEYMKAYYKQPVAAAKRNECMNSYFQKRKQTDSLFKLKINLRIRVQIALKKYSKTGKILKSKQYGIDYGKIIKHLGKPPATAFNVHHIIPLCCFDFNNLKAIEKAFAPENHAYTRIKEHETTHAELIKYGVQ